MTRFRIALILLITLLAFDGCGIYSFSGTSIQPDVKTICIEVRATAVTAEEVAAMNRLTITCKVIFTNVLHEEDNLEQSFAAYEDYDSNNSLDMVENVLCETIVKKLADDIFNATVAQW